MQHNPTPQWIHHIMDFMDTTPNKEAIVLEWYQVDEDVDIATELATTTMEIVMEPPVLKCNAIIPLPHSKNSKLVQFLSCEYDTDHGGHNYL